MNDTSQNRGPRELETRAAEERSPAWRPPTLLPDPHPRPGICHRWVRVAILGQADPVNYSMALREGWTPIKAADYPELQIIPDHGSQHADGVEVGGLLLCSASTAFMSQRRSYYGVMTERQMRSVNDQLEAEEDPRLRTMFREHNTSVSKGKGFAADARQRSAVKP